MTGIAMQALKNSDTIIGYTVYVDLVKDNCTGCDGSSRWCGCSRSTVDS